MRSRDLFAGTGWSVACRALGIEDHGVEWNEHARETRRINGMITVGSDVRDVNGADGEYVLEIGSPPCERFTQTGHQDGLRARQEIIDAVDGMTDPGDIYGVIKSLDAHHEKIGLVLEPFRVLLENPHARAAVWEQVVTVLPVWEAVARKLRAWGWSVDTRNVNASWYGVPQDRRRAILMARRDGEAKIPGKVEGRVMRDVFPDRDGWVQRSNYSAPSAYPGQTAQERGRTMRTLDQVSVTMTRKAAQWVHPDGSITRMTVADMAAVQTFPEEMVFAGGVGDQRLQIGNAVPPMMAEVLIRAALGLTLHSHGCNAVGARPDRPAADPEGEP
jgi:DNA (cytosine-5)-methyltransferase 1